MSDAVSGDGVCIASNSQSNLIEVHHIGVTAKLQSPLKALMQGLGSASETDPDCKVYGVPRSHTKYDKFSNGTGADTTGEASSSEASKVLYAMRAVRATSSYSTPARRRLFLASGIGGDGKRLTTAHRSVTETPSKIEFQLYSKKKKKTLPGRRKAAFKTAQKDCGKRQRDELPKPPSLFDRFRRSLGGVQQPNLNVNLIDLNNPDGPVTYMKDPAGNAKPSQCPNVGVYHFEHGCADYLRTTDAPPQICSLALADRATHYATRFWAEVFGSLHIGVAFIVTFFLQCYRFVLFSLVNTLLVGFLHMTSDYLVKPILTVLFNGFMQPILIFAYNVLASFRDILVPIADTLSNFLKPLAMLGRSLRLVQNTYNDKKFAAEV